MQSTVGRLVKQLRLRKDGKSEEGADDENGDSTILERLGRG